MNKQITLANYNKHAKKYNEWIDSNRTFEQDKYSDLLIENIPKNGRLLELGCGSAPNFSTKKFINHCDYTGVDYSQAQLNIARSKFPNTNFILDDIANVHFPPALFDAIVACYALFLLPFDEQLKMFDNIYKWLKPKGYFLSSYMAGDTQQDRPVNFFGTEHVYLFTTEQYKAIFKKTGFNIKHFDIITEMEFEEPEPILWIFAQKSYLDN